MDDSISPRANGTGRKRSGPARLKTLRAESSLSVGERKALDKLRSQRGGVSDAAVVRAGLLMQFKAAGITVVEPSSETTTDPEDEPSLISAAIAA